MEMFGIGVDVIYHLLLGRQVFSYRSSPQYLHATRPAILPRMRSIWGEDCKEFKPERWISKNGGIKHEPSYKFTTFGSGPRTCLDDSMVLHMNHGLKVKLTQRIGEFVELKSKSQLETHNMCVVNSTAYV
ncbi:cytochrome P450 [Artemisia annua]|uniref:Cytochrome P450 n=1 Tax=Artemisia annua TaxID=35608 RepID=A0A2U1P1N2_ARTAN|nr:cytochrome P450 [Artemisia annua]